MGAGLDDVAGGGAGHVFLVAHLDVSLRLHVVDGLGDDGAFALQVEGLDLIVEVLLVALLNHGRDEGGQEDDGRDEEDQGLNEQAAVAEHHGKGCDHCADGDTE